MPHTTLLTPSRQAKNHRLLYVVRDYMYLHDIKKITIDVDDFTFSNSVQPVRIITINSKDCFQNLLEPRDLNQASFW